MTESFLRYLQYEKRYSAHTIQSYQTDLEQFSQFLTGTFPDFNPETADYGIIRSWIISLVDEEIDARSVNRKIACLRSFYKFLLKEEVITKNPMTKIRVLKTAKKLPQFINEPDMNKILDQVTFENTFEGWRDKLILELFYGTGIRLAELIGLKEQDIDRRNNTIKVLGKRNKERVIPYAKSINAVIDNYLSFKNSEEIRKGNRHLFVTNDGEDCYPMMIYRTVRKYLNLFGNIDKRSPHVLRHTYATHLLNKGAEINAVKDLLGHSSLAATQVYTHNSLEKLKKAFDQAHPKA
ncbi:MAG TPA: tyrosine-type recombinase/integrase [Cyclobacteriaceae bacterium]|nr:tyrosine-type recombinase/integrase [Cyclobacteriaceae bacterium]